MRKIEKIKHIKRGWNLKTDVKEGDLTEVILENPKFQRIELVANIGEKGFSHDQILSIEPTGSVIIILLDEKKNKIYLHTEYRPAIIKKGTPKIKRGNLKVSFLNLGRKSIETVRGFSEGGWRKTAKKEIEEETGYKVTDRDLKRLGEINADTAFTVSNITVVLAKVNSKSKHKNLSKEEKEKILNWEWYKIKDVQNMIRKKEIFCALTLAALNFTFQELNSKKIKQTK